MSVSFSTTCRLLHRFIPITCRNIKVFVKDAQNLNTHAQKFGELGLTAEI